MMSNELLHPFEPSNSSDLREPNQPTMGRRDLIVKLTMAGVLAQLASLAVASAEERPRTRLVDVITPNSFHPINFPKLRIHSKKLDELPPNIQRIIFFICAPFCCPCHKMDERMRKQWASLPSDTTVIPVDAFFDENKLQKTDEELRASMRMPPLFEADGVTPSEDVMKELVPYRQSQPKGLTDEQLQRLRAIHQSQAEYWVRRKFERKRDKYVEDVNKHRQWLKEMHDFYTQKGGAGIYRHSEDEDEYIHSETPGFFVLRRSDGKAMRRPDHYTWFDDDHLWDWILGKRRAPRK